MQVKQKHPTRVVHWSSSPRDGGPWKAVDNNDHTHWSYTLLDLDNLDTSAHATTWTKILGTQSTKVITEISITHVSGVRASNHEWALNKVVALDGNGSFVDTSFKQLKWLAQGKEVIVTPVSTVKKLAFATQDAKEVIVGITWVDN